MEFESMNFDTERSPTMRTIYLFTIILLASAPLFAQDTTATDTVRAKVTDPTEARSSSWIGLEGTIRTVGARSFILAYDGGTLPVAYGGEALRQHQFQQDQKVTVYGWLDNDLFERKVLKASAISVHNEGGAQEVIGDDIAGALRQKPGTGTTVHGRVTGIDGRLITMDQANGRLVLDTQGMSYDPAQAQGHRRVEVGDVVTATGAIRDEFWSGRTMKVRTLDVVKMGMPEGERILDQAPVEDR